MNYRQYQADFCCGPDSFAIVVSSCAAHIYAGVRPNLNLHNTGNDLKRLFQSVNNPSELGKMITGELRREATRAGLTQPNQYAIRYGDQISVEQRYTKFWATATRVDAVFLD